MDIFLLDNWYIIESVNHPQCGAFSPADNETSKKSICWGESIPGEKEFSFCSKVQQAVFLTCSEGQCSLGSLIFFPAVHDVGDGHSM